MSKKLFFSIVIPTYNRSNDLKIALKSIIRQDFKNFEIIVSDNSQDNKSGQVCLAFNDKRIRYLKNKDNIGFARNLYQVVKMAEGEYVFILGDDDFIVSSDTLTNLHKTLSKQGYGYLRVKVLYHDGYKRIFDMNKLDNITPKSIPKNSNNWEILKFIHKANVALISGLIIKNPSSIRIPEIEKSRDPDFTLEVFWIKFIYEQTKKYGAYVDTEDIIMVKWVIQTGGNSACASEKAPSLYAVINNKLYTEKSWNLVFERLNAEERKRWIKEQTELMVPLLPSVKFYSDNKNLLLYGKRMSELNGYLYTSLAFYLFTIIGLLMPRWLWNWLRTLVQNNNIVYNQKLIQELESFKKIYVD